jgi:hypothetical protein
VDPYGGAEEAADQGAVQRPPPAPHRARLPSILQEH